MEHFPRTPGRAGGGLLAARIQGHFVRRGFGLWAAEVPGRAAFIGFVGLAVPAFRPLHPLRRDRLAAGL